MNLDVEDSRIVFSYVLGPGWSYSIKRAAKYKLEFIMAYKDFTVLYLNICWHLTYES